jgi:hypothetical protein
LAGGLFSQPAGKIGNVVFGAARDRSGKVVTAREFVKPSNPQTPGQTTQRNKFSQSLDIVREVGPDVYQGDWNRAIGQLAGFQSWMSIMLNAMDDNLDLTQPPTINLGTLHFPNTSNVAVGAAGEADVTWSTDGGDNGTANDQLQVVAIPSLDTVRDNNLVRVIQDAALRSAGAFTITGLDSGSNYTIVLYFDGAGSADGLLSQARWYQQDAG